MMEEPHKELFKNGNREFTYIPHKVKFINEKNREKNDEEKA